MDDVELRLQLDPFAGAKIVSFGEHGANLGTRQRGIDERVGSGRLDPGSV